MTLDENIEAFQPFIDNLLSSVDPAPNIFLDPNGSKELVKQSESWNNSINSEIERVQKELTEKEFEFYLKAIDQTHKSYNSRFLNRK